MKMTTPTRPDKHAKAKCALAALLGIVFLGVVWSRFAPEGAAEEWPPQATTAREPVQQVNETSLRSEADSAEQRADPMAFLPTVDIERVLRLNPFTENDALTSGAPITRISSNGPKGSNSVRVARPSPEEANPTQQEETPPIVSAIVHGKQPAVLLDDGQLAHERDIVNDRWRVIAILRDSVVLEAVD